MKYLTFYDSDGKICLTFSGEESIVEQVKLSQVSLSSLEGFYDFREYYIEDSIAKLRPEQSTIVDKEEILANGIDVLTISSAPDNATFTAFDITNNLQLSGTFSGSETFSTTKPGTIRILIEKFPYLPFEKIIYAV